MGFRFSLAPLLALIAFAGSAGVVWFAHIEAGEMTLDRRPPLVKASSTPLKRSPADPGGRAVADLGGVGDLLRDQPAETEERLLPSPEQPVTPTDDGGNPDARAALEALVSEIQSDRSEGGLGGPNPDAPVNFPSPSRPGSTVEAPEPVTPEPVTPRSVSSLETPATSQPAEQDHQVETEIAAISPTFEATADGRFRVQLAAVREEADAERAWELFQSQLGPFISGLQPFFERAETSNGIFYRVQVGPFGATEDADRLCAELKKQDASCFVVSR